MIIGEATPDTADGVTECLRWDERLGEGDRSERREVPVLAPEEDRLRLFCGCA